MSDGYIAWAQFWCPEPVRQTRAPLQKGMVIYDAVDERLGDDAEGDDFLTRVLWLETAIRLARVGWTIEELEAARWPVANRANLRDLMRSI